MLDQGSGGGGVNYVNSGTFIGGGGGGGVGNLVNLLLKVVFNWCQKNGEGRISSITGTSTHYLVAAVVDMVLGQVVLVVVAEAWWWSGLGATSGGSGINGMERQTLVVDGGGDYG